MHQPGFKARFKELSGIDFDGFIIFVDATLPILNKAAHDFSNAQKFPALKGEHELFHKMYDFCNRLIPNYVPAATAIQAAKMKELEELDLTDDFNDRRCPICGCLLHPEQ